MSAFYAEDAPWKTLEQVFWAHTVDELKILAAALPGPGIEARVKAERIELLCQRLTGEALRDLWSRLTEPQQAAVALAVHTPDASLNPAGFKIRYGEAPDFGEEVMVGHGLKKPSLLCFFIHGRHVPLDLRQRLLAFVPRPSPLDLPAVGEVPATIAVFVPPHHAGNRTQKSVKRRRLVYRSRSERRAVAELAGVLRLVEAGQIAVTPRTLAVNAKSRRLISEVLEGGDFLTPDRWTTVKAEEPPRPEDLSIRSFAWPQLLAQTRLIRPRSGRMQLTAAGKKALRSPPAAVLRDLWRAWRDGADFDELHRIHELRGLRRCELSDPRQRRAAIGRALAECPPGEWVAVDAFFDHVRAAGHDFRITSTPWEIYFDDLIERVPVDSFYDEDEWRILQGRTILCLLFEVAATLGMVDVAYTSPVCARLVLDTLDMDFVSRYDGLRYFRLTTLGLYCLDLVKSHEIEAPSVRGVLRVTGDLTITAAVREIPRSTAVVLERYARKVAVGGWRLERPALLAAVESGLSVAGLKEFLVEHSSGPLPRKVQDFLDDCEARARSLKLRGPAQILECPDARLAKRIAGDPRTGKHCMLAGERCLVVPEGAVPAFRRALRKLGYGWPQQ